jgi:hypothetical protein
MDKDYFPIPRIDDTTETFVGVKWFSTLNLNCGNCEIVPHSSDKKKTAFSTKQGL